MNYPRTLKLAEFVRMFDKRYVVDAGDGIRVLSLPEEDVLFLISYIYSGIINSTVAPRNGVGSLTDLVESQGPFTEQHDMGLGLKVTATEADLKAIGMLFVNGLANVFQIADQLCVGLKSEESKYADH